MLGQAGTALAGVDSRAQAVSGELRQRLPVLHRADSRPRQCTCTHTRVSLLSAYKRCLLSTTTAIPAFGFEGHISAAVSRGPAPSRSRGWRGPAFDRSYYACLELTMTFFSAFFHPTIGRRLAFCLLSFLHRSLRLTKSVLKPKKKVMQALFPPEWRAPRI